MLYLVASQTSVSFNMQQKEVFNKLFVAGYVSGSFSDFVHKAFDDYVIRLRVDKLEEVDG